MDRTLERVQLLDNARVIQIERFLNHPVNEVWAALTEPQRLSDWLANAQIELSKGGKLELRFDNTGAVVRGTVTDVKAPNILEYTWDSQQVPQNLPAPARSADERAEDDAHSITLLQGSKIRWELKPAEGGGTVLTLTHSAGSPPVPAAARERGSWLSADPQREPHDQPHIVIASWNEHLNQLDIALDSPGRNARREATWDWTRWEGLRSKYARTLG